MLRHGFGNMAAVCFGVRPGCAHWGCAAKRIQLQLRNQNGCCVCCEHMLFIGMVTDNTALQTSRPLSVIPILLFSMEH